MKPKKIAAIICGILLLVASTPMAETKNRRMLQKNGVMHPHKILVRSIPSPCEKILATMGKKRTAESVVWYMACLKNS